MNSLFAAFAVALIMMQAVDTPVDTPIESPHRRGPHHLEGWTLNGTLPDHPGEHFPTTLVIARHGRVIRKIDDGPFVWNWMFVDDGKRVAYESGSLHFNDTCVLQDIQSGKVLRQYDCYRDLPAGAPGWAKRLMAHPKDPTS